MKRISSVLYAQALADVLHANPHHDAAHLKRFAALVRHNGHVAQFPEILRALEAAVRKKAGKKLLRIESARTLPPHSIAEIQKSLGAHGYDFEERINPELVAGVRLTENNERQYDGSLSRLLSEIFA